MPLTNILRPAVAVTAALLLLLGCTSPTVTTADGTTATTPEDLVVVIPAGFVGNLDQFMTPTASRVRVLAVDAAGRTTELADLTLSSDAANPHFAEAQRASAVAALRALPIPPGDGRADLLAGARVAVADPQASLVHLADTGCLTVAGQTLDGVDLTSSGIDTTLAALDAAGVLSGLSSSDDVLVFAGASSCADSGVTAAAQTQLFAELCRRITTDCLAREANTTAAAQ